MNARALQEAAGAKNFELLIDPIARAEEIVATIDKARASGATALNVLASEMLDGNVPLIIERVAALRLPAMYQWGMWAERGGFIGNGPPIDHLADLTARYAASLLRGTMPANLPIEQPTKLEPVINLKTAKAMGVTVPAGLLARADKVIEWDECWCSLRESAHGPSQHFLALQTDLYAFWRFILQVTTADRGAQVIFGTVPSASNLALSSTEASNCRGG